MIETIALAISRTEIELAAARRPSKRAGIHRTGLADLDHLPASRQIVDHQFVDRLDTDDRLDLGPRHGERSYLSPIGHALPCRRRFEGHRSEEHTSELQSLMRISYAVFCLTKKKSTHTATQTHL